MIYLPVTQRFDLAVSLWAFHSGHFGQALSVGAVSVWAVPVPERFSLGRSGLELYQSGYEILEKSYVFTFCCKRS